MVIVKRRDATANWEVRHVSIAAANSIQLNLINGAASATTVWNSTAPTSTVFSIGTSTNVNANTGTYVAYCWAEIAGFSKFGSYVGNGSADSPFIYLGFRPKFVLIKDSSITPTGYNWRVIDASRLGYNPDNYLLFPSVSDAEGSTVVCDLLSNGMKLRTTSLGLNTNGETYIYMAFAENPFKNANAR